MAKAVLIVVILGAALVALTLWRASAREAAAMQSHPPEGQLLDVNGVQVHAVITGQGPDVVLIHGASGNTRDMTFRLAPALADRYRVIVFDRPGLGYTDRINTTGASLTEQADLLVAAARQLGADRPIVMGQSYGGGVALAWALNHPEMLSALVPVSAVSNPWDTPLDTYYSVLSSWWGKRFVTPLITAFVPKAVVNNAVDEVFAPQSAPDGYNAHLGAGLTLRRISMRANADQRANLKSEIVAQYQRYGDISVPTEIVHGTADTTVGLSLHSEKLVRQIPGAVLTRLEGIGHMPHQVASEDIVAAIDRAAARAGLR
ncbi:alpha/beta fold hydrolase [Arenibacterium halophilum]|nr:alpha/beta hydrolase [Arenibacterium halophilum]